MEGIGPQRRPLSRETRLLLVTVLVSLAALWVLARIRFSGAPVTPNPIAPVLTQLAPPPVFDQLSVAMFQVQSRLTPLLFPVDVAGSAPSGEPGRRTIVALRLDPRTAVAILEQPATPDRPDMPPAASLIARDPVSGLTLLRVSEDSASDTDTALSFWSPRQPLSPRYLIAGEMSRGLVSARPLLVGPLEAMMSPVWSDVVWELPPGTDADPGTFVFSTDGALAGVVARTGARLVLVPADVLKEAAGRLEQWADRAYGQLGIDVQPLSPAIASVTGAEAGVVVTAVDPQGPAAGQLEVTDVIVGVGDEPLASDEHWSAIESRVAVGQTIALQVRRGGEVRTVPLTAVAASTAVETSTSPAPVPLGLTMRTRPRVGVEVVRVAPESAAARAGLRTGDIITVFGDRKAPTPAQVRAHFAEAPAHLPTLVAITRGNDHLVVTIENR